jgi:uncharacterized membrane protein YphA (DoxX/SURF4 family)
MNFLLEKTQRFAPNILRIGIALVFLWFGSQQIINANMWTNLIPAWITSASGINAIALVHLNGAFEIVFGLCLFLGYFTRVSAFLLALHMLDITFIVGYTSIGIRDFGLSIATISIFLHGIDSWCLDRFLIHDKTNNLV